MRDVYDVIVSPVVTEKSATALEERNVYTFIVNRDSNKIEISSAGVTVTGAQIKLN